MFSRIKIGSWILAAILTFPSFGQQASDPSDPILLTVGKEKISLNDFDAIYKKNNKNANEKPSEASVREYLELFKIFKLKVRDAEAMGLDTTAKFRNEYKDYRKVLAQPYLSDKEAGERLIQEAHERLEKEIHAGHILLRIDQDALPKDTLAVYTKIIELRNRILKGEKFESVAEQYSEDPSAKQNKGDLGFFTAFSMVYPFENAAYNTPVGGISMPIRTRFGYHIVKVMEARANRGQVKVAHIMFKYPNAQKDKPTAQEDIATARQKANEILTKIKNGENFEELAKQFSDDKQSAPKGGEIPMFTSGKMIASFEDACFNLNTAGQISDLVETPYGIHIIKFLEKKPVGTYTELFNELKSKVGKDSRSQQTQESLLKKIKAEYYLQEFPSAKTNLWNAVDSSYYKGIWRMEKAEGYNQALFNLKSPQKAIRTYTQQEYAKFLYENQSPQTKKTAALEVLLEKQYEVFLRKSLLEFEDTQLEYKYPEFRRLSKEYRDGILLFDAMDQQVWTKAMTDTTGLKNFFAGNATKYQWAERTEVIIYKVKDEEMAKKVRKMAKKGSAEEVIAFFNKDSQLNVVVEKGLFSKGDNEFVDKTTTKSGLSDNYTKDNRIVFVKVIKKLVPAPKLLSETKGPVTSDYQAELEKKWVQSIKTKYPVNVNEEVLQTIYK